jgi:hypothetical protein
VGPSVLVDIHHRLSKPPLLHFSVWLCRWTCVWSNFNLFILLKLSVVCIFWIILMCWCQKWFLKNKKTSLAYISARKAIWKATTTTLPNTFF